MVTRKTVIIERNDAPYGLLEIFVNKRYNFYLFYIHNWKL